MARSTPSYLKVYQEQHSPAERPAPAIGSLPEVLRAFRHLTGWSLQYMPEPQNADPVESRWSAPVNPGVGIPPGLLRLDPAGPPSPTVSRDPKAVREMASAVAGMLGELLQSQHALWLREAELAAAAPVTLVPESEKDLAQRLSAILRAGAEALGCHAAGLYLLDDATTTLKLRSCWGLPHERFTQPPYPLKGALADLEAMLGHAVVLDDTRPLPQWNPPEDFPAAVCVPVSTPTAILGTLWIFSNKRRDFTGRDTNLVEVIAGRLAVELERQTLLQAHAQRTRIDRDLSAAQRLQQSQTPASAPLWDGWELAGWSAQAEHLSSSFFDWFSTSSGRLAAAACHVRGSSIESALTANGVRATLRSHAQYHRGADRLLNQVNLTLWTSSAGDQAAALAVALVEPTSGRVQCATAGPTLVLVLDESTCRPLQPQGPLLGTSPEAVYVGEHLTLRPRQSLIVVHRDCPQSETAVAEGDLRQLIERLSGRSSLSAKELVALARRDEGAQTAAPCQDRCVLVLKHAPVT